jgi:putative two-component system hydrogenase maturation factor HypX/HoxX
MGLCDKVLDKNHAIFKAQVKHLVNGIITDNETYRNCLHEKAKTRCYDESLKALASYRKFELTQMHASFYGNDGYHVSRRNRSVSLFMEDVCMKKVYHAMLMRGGILMGDVNN